MKSKIQWIEGMQNQGMAPIQEDFFEVNAERGIFILADGFGGSPGKAAAKSAVQFVKQFLEQEAGDLDATLPFELRQYFSLAGNVLFNAISFANHKVIKLNEVKTWLNSGGASLVAGYLEGKLLSIANVGTNTVYLKRSGKVKEIVSPKSLGRQIDPFNVDAEGKHVPLMSLGTVKHLEPEMVEIEVQSGDEIIFQTAGINEDHFLQLIKLKNQAEIRQYFDDLSTSQNASLIWISL